jgi:hypothetical protein
MFLAHFCATACCTATAARAERHCSRISRAAQAVEIAGISSAVRVRAAVAVEVVEAVGGVELAVKITGIARAARVEAKAVIAAVEAVQLQ